MSLSLQTHPTDVRYFDPIMTSIPATISDLIPTQRDLHLEGFDFVANVEPSLQLRGDSIREEEGEGAGGRTEEGERRDGQGEGGRVQVEVEVEVEREGEV